MRVCRYPTNIAEGRRRGGDADFSRFLYVAIGSACELEYLLIFAKDVGFITSADHQLLEQNLQEVKRMLTSLIRTLKS